MNLYLTASGRYVGTQAEARADGKGWTPEEVPTDKAGLIAYLNRDRDNAVEAKLVIDDMSWNDSAVLNVERARTPTAYPLTQGQVDEMFKPRALRTLQRDEVCTAIAQYSGTDLGYVALEVAARYTSLAKT